MDRFSFASLLGDSLPSPRSRKVLAERRHTKPFIDAQKVKAHILSDKAIKVIENTGNNYAPKAIK